MLVHPFRIYYYLCFLSYTFLGHFTDWSCKERPGETGAYYVTGMAGGRGYVWAAGAACCSSTSLDLQLPPAASEPCPPPSSARDVTRYVLPPSARRICSSPQPMQPDPSVSEITPAQYSLIISSLPPSPATSFSPDTSQDPRHKLSDLPPFTREAAKIWRDANDPPLSGDSSIQTGPRSVAESFILLSDSALHPKSSKLPSKSLPPHDLDLSAQLHQILSSNTPVSHPLCTECTALLTAEFQRMAEELGKERDAYIWFEQAIRKNKESLGTAEISRKTVNTRHVDGLAKYDVEGTEEEWGTLVKRKGQLEVEEERLKRQLESTEKELEAVLEEERLVELEAKAVEQEENESVYCAPSCITDILTCIAVSCHPILRFRFT